jgi:hypothetical protein
MKKILSIVIVLAALLGLALIAVSLTPQPMSSDLTLVDQGKPSVVLAYENFSPTGGAALSRLKELRPDYESQINFIVADLGTPDGRNFASRHGLVDGQAVLLNKHGSPFTVAGPQTPDEMLRQALDDVIASDR